jgi:ABC-2 type transport system ATP-binding protein
VATDDQRDADGACVPLRAPVLEVTSLLKAYGDRPALRGVSFSLAKGETFGLLGPNGAGKTTTLQIVCGLLRADDGSATVHGIDVGKDTAGAQRLIGYLPQETAVFPPLSVRRNLRFVAELRGLRGRTRDQRVAEVLEELDLGSLADRRCGELSGGEQRRVSLGMALVHRPPVLVLDEPTSGIDVTTRRVLHEWIHATKAAGTTILYSTHYLEEAQALCDRVAILDRGAIVVCDSVASLMSTFGSGLLEVRGAGPVHAELLHELERACREVFVADTATARPGGQNLVRVTDVGDRVVVSCPDPQQVLVPALKAYLEHGTAVVDVTVSPPTLESAFLAVTGSLFDAD